MTEKINWEAFAKLNGLSKEGYINEIFDVVGSLGLQLIEDQNGDNDAVIVTLKECKVQIIIKKLV